MAIDKLGIPPGYLKQEQTYRDKALKMYPWICGRCAREFVYSNLRELTVHHRDHNHDNNPADGSNWELLCVYCHDHEHTKFHEYVLYGSTRKGPYSSNLQPFRAIKRFDGKEIDIFSSYLLAVT